MAKTSRSRSTLLLLGSAVAVAAAGCGGGGGGSTGVPTQLAFTVNWEQPLAGAASVSAPSPGGAAAFDTPIPPSVNAIRFLFRPSGGPACCVAVPRGSQAFEERHIQLANVIDGPATLEVNGFPTDFAPSAGVTATCATREPQGVPCSGDQTQLPSWGSDEIELDILAGQTNVVDVDVHSLPFLLDLDPANEGTVNDNSPGVSFAVVDAVHPIDLESLSVRLRHAPTTVFANIADSEPCDDGASGLPDCSEGGALDVAGYLVTAESPDALPNGETELRIRASNTAPTPRDMESNTVFFINTTETTTSTTVTTTSSTETSTTSTTLGEPQTFCLVFRVANQVDLVGLSYTVDYAETGGDFLGSGEDVVCQRLINGDNLLLTFNDDDGTGRLYTAFADATPYSGPFDVAVCQFSQVPPLDLSNMSIQVTEATGSDLSSVNATVAVEEVQCLQ